MNTLNQQLPVEILRFGERRYYGVNLDDLINCTDCVLDRIKEYDVKSLMHINITINTNIMSERDHYQINLYFVMILMEDFTTDKDRQVVNYLLDYFEKELEYNERNPNKPLHSGTDSIKQIINSYNFKSLMQQFPVYRKEFKATSGLKYNFFMIDATTFFMYLYRASDFNDFRVIKALKDLQHNYMKDAQYCVKGVFNKDYYLSFHIAKEIAEKYLFKNGIKEEISPFLLNYKEEFCDVNIIQILDIIEYLEIIDRAYPTGSSIGNSIYI